MHHPHPAPSTTPVSDSDTPIKRGKKRGSYNCGRCGLPKKGHTCSTPAGDVDSSIDPLSTPSVVSSSPRILGQEYGARGCMPGTRRRALSFGDLPAAAAVELAKDELKEEHFDLEEDLDSNVDLEGSGGLPMSCLSEIFRRLQPTGLLEAARVCRGWREASRRVWRAAEELCLRVPANAQIGCVGSVLKKCPGLLRLSLSMESDFDATMLACIAFSCPNLQSLEVFAFGSSVNRITGDELSRFASDKRCLTSLKMDGCSNLGGFVISSTSLSTIWLSDLHSLSKMIFNCPNLKEVSLDFSCRENDSTNLVSVLDTLGRSCPKLQNIHVASSLLSHKAVLALSTAKLRALQMLSLVLGSDITDASVAAIASSFPKLELLDLSGSGISDSGIGMICNVFSETLTKLLLALCPNITSSGIQFAAAQLPYLELMDCGMTLCDSNSENEVKNDKTPNKVQHLIYQKLIIKHSQLKKLSLWGCSGLDALSLNCPNLNDLNLNSCRNLHPERLLLECPNLESVHASNCKDMLVKAIETQVCSDFSALENDFPRKRLPDGSKRVGAPSFHSPQTRDDKKQTRPTKRRRCEVFSD